VIQVDSINLAGLDRVLVVYAAGSSDRSLMLRQYRIAFKKSGTKVGGWVGEGATSEGVGPATPRCSWNRPALCNARSSNLDLRTWLAQHIGC